VESKKLLDSGLTFEWQLEEPTMHLFKRNCVADLKKHAPPHMCYRVKFGSSAERV